MICATAGGASGDVVMMMASHTSFKGWLLGWAWLGTARPQPCFLFQCHLSPALHHVLNVRLVLVFGDVGRQDVGFLELASLLPAFSLGVEMGER